MPAPARILLTGASGFVGGHLLPALRAAFPEARLIATSRSEEVRGADEVLTLDLLDAGNIAAAVEAAQPTAVLHLAAQAAVSASFADPLGTWRINLFGTLALADAVMRKAPAASFILAASAEAYGLSFQSGEPLDEDAPFRPTNPYAASKAAADLAVGEMALRGLHAIRLRPFNHTGPGQTDAFVVPAFARQLARVAAGLQEPVLRVGALDRWRDFLDVRDVCAAYVAALRAAPSLPAGSTFNIASGISRRVGDILTDMVAAVGIPVEIREDAARLRATDIMRAEADASRARDVLGWSPQVPWRETLAAVLADWRTRTG